MTYRDETAQSANEQQQTFYTTDAELQTENQTPVPIGTRVKLEQSSQPAPGTFHSESFHSRTQRSDRRPANHSETSSTVTLVIAEDEPEYLAGQRILNVNSNQYSDQQPQQADTSSTQKRYTTDW
jgi:hypothetical protein